MRINHNISALQANRQNKLITGSLDKSLEKLSSGKRINKSGDDAAGLAISQKMRAQVNGLEQASKNTSDGISLVQTADGTLNEIHAMTQRMRELAVQTANGTYDAVDRNSVQAEINQLNDEINRISKTIEFNGTKLLNGDLNCRNYVSEPEQMGVIDVSCDVKPGSYQVGVTGEASRAVIEGTQAKTGIQVPAVGSEPAKNVISGDRITAAGAGTIFINKERIEIKEGMSSADIYQAIKDACQNVGAKVIATSYTGFTAPAADPNLPKDIIPSNESVAGYEKVVNNYTFNDRLVIMSNEYGADQRLEITGDNLYLMQSLGLDGIGSKTGTDVKATISQAGPPVTMLGDYSKDASITVKGNDITVKDKNGFEIRFSAKPGAFNKGTIGVTPAVTQITSTLNVLRTGPIDIQAGANSYQTLSLRIPKVTAETLGTDKLNLCSQESAQKALDILDVAVNRVSSVRARIGAYQNRLEHTVASIDGNVENTTASLARIEDTDMAEEMAKYTQQNVIQQAATSMLAKANQRPESVLQLLQQ